jgi:tetratricopeptide (TPR) repeat protein
MKIVIKAAAAGLGLLFAGSSVFAQSLADAKLAISAEQYQKAKSMLKNLVSTQSTKDENYFYLGWVYVKQDYPDSAKVVFQKGLNVNPKSALNYAGLGTVALMDKDKATATNDFNQAVSLAGKDSKPYIYVAKGYLLPGANGKVPQANAQAALDVLNKGNTASAVKNKDRSIPPASNDPELFITRGEANRQLLKTNDAYTDYSTAVNLDPKSPAVHVALGTLWKNAQNYEDANKEFQNALSIDANYGPAYREMAETDFLWAESSPQNAKAKMKEAVDNYKKYLSLTDNSVESQMRYADFLINAGDYQTLQQVAADLSKSANSNLRVYRYLAYAAYQNKDYQAGLTAMNTWMTKADPKRIIPLDYLYLGRLQMATGQDSVGIQTLKKALQLDSSTTDAYQEIAQAYFKAKKYKEAGDYYQTFSEKSPKATLQDHFFVGYSYYFAYTLNKNKTAADTVLLNKADSAFSYVAQKASSPVAPVVLYRARIADLRETDRNNIKGYAKPLYEKYIEVALAKGTPDATTKTNLVEAYDYLGAYYEFKEKDQAKAAENYGKAHDLDPTDKQAAEYLKRKGGAKSK